MPEKLNLVKEYKDYYSAKLHPKVVENGHVPYLSIIGKGEPAGKNFIEAVGALYPLAYGIKFIYKLKEYDFAVPKLEGLWWVDSDKPGLEVPREEWHWKLMIRMPEFVSKENVEIAKENVIKKKKIDLVKSVKFESINEGKCVQIMHIGPYITEPETIEKMELFMEENQWVKNGLHHEIYLSDPRKTAPEKMKTILRQPVKCT